MAASPEKSTPQPPSLHNLPEGLNPDSIDTVPILSALLSRLPDSSSTVPTTSTAGSPPAGSPSNLATGTGPLGVKDIPLATNEIKHKFQRARAQIKELPDIERSLEEQEEEIRDLEEKIARQRAVLAGLRDVGLEAKKEREIMEKDVMQT